MATRGTSPYHHGECGEVIQQQGETSPWNHDWVKSSSTEPWNKAVEHLRNSHRYHPTQALLYQDAEWQSPGSHRRFLRCRIPPSILTLTTDILPTHNLEGPRRSTCVQNKPNRLIEEIGISSFHVEDDQEAPVRGDVGNPNMSSLNCIGLVSVLLRWCNDDVMLRVCNTPASILCQLIWVSFPTIL